MLVRGLNHNSQAAYRAAFIVRPDSKIRELAGLVGRSLALGAVDSTQGHLIPRIALHRHQIDLSDLAAYQYLGSHQNCAEAVVAGLYDACALQGQMARLLVAEGNARIIYLSGPFPSSGVVASKTLPAEARRKIQQALIDFEPHGKHRQLLYNWDKTEVPMGFIRADEKDFDELKKWFNEFDFQRYSPIKIEAAP
jgi:phosphonate transport system substrate-binding protein